MLEIDALTILLDCYSQRRCSHDVDSEIQQMLHSLIPTFPFELAQQWLGYHRERGSPKNDT